VSAVPEPPKDQELNIVTLQCMALLQFDSLKYTLKKLENTMYELSLTGALPFLWFSNVFSA